MCTLSVANLVSEWQSTLVHRMIDGTISDSHKTAPPCKSAWRLAKYQGIQVYAVFGVYHLWLCCFPGALHRNVSEA